MEAAACGDEGELRISFSETSAGCTTSSLRHLLAHPCAVPRYVKGADVERPLVLTVPASRCEFAISSWKQVSTLPVFASTKKTGVDLSDDMSLMTCQSRVAVTPFHSSVHKDRKP